MSMVKADAREAVQKTTMEKRMLLVREGAGLSGLESKRGKLGLAMDGIGRRNRR